MPLEHGGYAKTLQNNYLLQTFGIISKINTIVKMLLYSTIACKSRYSNHIKKIRSNEKLIKGIFFRSAEFIKTIEFEKKKQLQ